MYGQLFPDSFEPFPKNPHLAQIFTQIGRSEELGTGLRNVYKYSKEYSGSDDIQFLEEDIFVTRIPLTPNVPLNVPLNERQKKIIQLLVSENSTISEITLEELANKLEVSLKTVKRDMEDLRINNLIERVGSRKTGYWKIRKDR